MNEINYLNGTFIHIRQLVNQFCFCNTSNEQSLPNTYVSLDQAIPYRPSQENLIEESKRLKTLVMDKTS